MSALVATILEANLLVLVSDIDGIFNKNPHLHDDAILINEVDDLNSIQSYIEERQSILGTGGMSSKIHAAEICRKNNVEMWIVNGQRQNYIINALDGMIAFTRFKK